jgi:hypothetical protein
MSRARWPRRSPELPLDEQLLHDSGQVGAQVLDRTTEGRPNRHRGPVGRNTDLDVHAGRIELGEQRFGELDVPPVELLDRFPTGPDDELRNGRSQGYTVAEHPINGRPHAFLHDGHHRRVCSFIHGPDATGPV